MSKPVKGSKAWVDSILDRPKTAVGQRSADEQVAAYGIRPLSLEQIRELMGFTYAKTVGPAVPPVINSETVHEWVDWGAPAPSIFVDADVFSVPPPASRPRPTDVIWASPPCASFSERRVERVVGVDLGHPAGDKGVAVEIEIEPGGRMTVLKVLEEES